MIPKCKQKEYDSGWINLNEVVRYRKKGNVVTVVGFSSGKISLIANDYKTIGQLPINFRPSVELISNWARIGENTVGTLKINSSGEISLYSSSGNSYYGFTITFIV